MSASVKSLIVVVVLVLIGVGAFLLIGSDDEAIDTSNNTEKTTQAQPSEQQPASGTPAETVTLNKEEVATHNTADDCWTIIDGSVYDITEYVPRHPGGDEILRACGADGTSLFNERTTEDGQEIGSGTPHSARAESQLQAFRLGSLEQ